MKTKSHLLVLALAISVPFASYALAQKTRPVPKHAQDAAPAPKPAASAKASASPAASGSAPAGDAAKAAAAHAAPASSSGHDVVERESNIEFDERMVKGQTAAGAIYLFQRSPSEFKSIVKVPDTFRPRTTDLLSPRRTSP
jgi:hypothetical protein